ncbi:MAG: RagB/SusD family nutrient uptake outer membrane protein [Haliscomenobacter sp.]|nr:RagB/SusD family nutrient uptake outer membrane protein [Haliscomenobacter sp.]
MNKLLILRKSLIFLAVFLIAGLFPACEKDTTDLLPFDRLTDVLAFDTPKRVELSMVGVYDAAQSGFYAGGAVRGYPFGAANVAQGDNRGEDMLNVATFYAITYEATYNPTTANNDFHWQTLYSLINRANIVIEGAQNAATKGIITDAQAKAYEGEARFLRVLAHHELLIHFARLYKHTAGATHLGVPYRTTPVNTTDNLNEAVAKPRNTVKECYDLMFADLNFAEQNLPEKRSGSQQISRVTQGAAIALKTRLYLHTGDWANVVTEGNKLITKATYKLTATPEGPFAGYTSNTESVFSIENSQADNSGVNGALPVMYSIAPGRLLVAISPIIWNAPFWDATDLRRTQLAKNNGRAWFSHKYRNITTQDDWNPILRYAEVLLNVAEAQSRQGKTPEALALLNQVRNRAVTDVAKQYTDASFADAKAMTKAILNERRIEFLGEGRRWADIHRLALDPDFSTGGIPKKVRYNNTTFASWSPGKDYDANGVYIGAAATLAAIPYDDYRFLWPIPTSELNTNPTLAAQQNPGY